MKFHKQREMHGILEGVGFQVLVEDPVSHSFSLFMLCECFQKDRLGQTNLAAEVLGGWLKKIAPWGDSQPFAVRWQEIGRYLFIWIQQEEPC